MSWSLPAIFTKSADELALTQAGSISAMPVEQKMVRTSESAVVTRGEDMGLGAVGLVALPVNLVAPATVVLLEVDAAKHRKIGFAARYKSCESETASMLLFSTLSLAVTVPVILWLTHHWPV